MDYNKFGYKSKEEYFKEFFDTLLLSNKTEDYFVDWGKINNNVRKYINEISLLNSLVFIKDKNERKDHLRDILSKYPETRNVIPLIISVRDSSLYLLKLDDSYNISYLDIDFHNSDVNKIINFCEYTKIIDLFGSIKDLYSYLTGMEVGSDTNARKNRSGFIFEEMSLNILLNEGLDVRKAKSKINIGNRSKLPDILLYKNNEIYAFIEVNFYNGVGSKPLETMQSYINLQRDAHSQDIKFIWITDGPGWKSGIIEREKGFEQIDYIFNLTLAKKLIKII